MVKNELDAIIVALRECGCDVVQADFITLIVGRGATHEGSGDGQTYLLQYGDRELSDDQVTFFRNWRGHFAVVTTPFDALDAVGIIDER